MREKRFTNHFCIFFFSRFLVIIKIRDVFKCDKTVEIFTNVAKFYVIYVIDHDILSNIVKVIDVYLGLSRFITNRK